jgi:hypothetical protein
LHFCMAAPAAIASLATAVVSGYWRGDSLAGTRDAQLTLRRCVFGKIFRTI